MSVNGKGKCDITHTHTHTHRYNATLFSYKKEGNPAICNDMDETGGHYSVK